MKRFFSNVLSYPLPDLVDAQEMKDSAKSPDYIERLARKYMVTFFLIAAFLSLYENTI